MRDTRLVEYWVEYVRCDQCGKEVTIKKRDAGLLPTGWRTLMVRNDYSGIPAGATGMFPPTSQFTFCSEEHLNIWKDKYPERVIG